MPGQAMPGQPQGTAMQPQNFRMGMPMQAQPMMPAQPMQPAAMPPQQPQQPQNALMQRARGF